MKSKNYLAALAMLVLITAQLAFATALDDYVAAPEPKEGWTAFFVEMIYDSGGEIPYKFTTQVHVVPQRLPFAK